MGSGLPPSSLTAAKPGTEETIMCVDVHKMYNVLVFNLL